VLTVVMTMHAESGTPSELELARERLARSRAHVQRSFRPSGERGSARVSPFVRGLAVRGVQALAAGPGGAEAGMRLGLAVAALVAMMLTRGRSRDRGRGRGLGLAISLALAIWRFSRRR
jgi:hypothetical protein